jgi:hypothetical protein
MPPVVAGVAAIAATVGSVAAAAGAAIASIGGFLGGIGILGQIAISVGLNYVAQALFGGPKGGGSAATGVRGSIASGGTVPQSFICGRYCTAGSLVYAGVWGKDGDTPNAYLTYVIALSDLPVSGLAGLFVNEKRATYNTGLTPATQGYPIIEYRVSGKDHLWVSFHDGSQTAVDSFLSTKFGSHANYPYDSGMVGYGRAYVIVTALVNQSLFSSFPNYKFEVDGVKLYDQRKDSTASGSGSHRFGTASTYELTSNPMVVAHNILRGVYYSTDWFYGLQDLNANRCPSTPWFAAMNECDVDVDDVDGNPEDQFRCGLEITVDTPPADIIEELLKSCNGRLAEVGGSYKPYVGAAGSSIYSFTDSDVIISQPQTFDMFPGEDKLANGIAAVYPEPDEGWGTRDAPLRTDAALVTEDDGRELIANVNYAAVPYKSQVQRLQTSALYEARKFRRHTLVLPPSAYKLEPNDYIDWTSTKNGYISKLFRVDAVTDNRNLDVPVVISEVDPADYDFDTISDYLAQTSQTVASGDLPDPLDAPTGLAFTQASGSITLTWDALVSPLLSGYDVLVAAQGDVIGNATYLDRDRKARDFTTAALSAGDYTVFVRGVDVYGQAGTAADLDVTVATVVGGAVVTNFYSVLSELTLTTNLKLCLDFGDSTCYSGSGQSIYDLTANDTDFYNGSGSGSDSADATFNGSAGSLSSDTYFSFSDADYMTLIASNPTWVQNLHKSGTKGTVMALFYYPGWTSDGIFSLVSTMNDHYGFTSTNGIDVSIYVAKDDPNNAVFRLQLMVMSNNAIYIQKSIGFGQYDDTPPPGWYFVGVSWDDGAAKVSMIASLGAASWYGAVSVGTAGTNSAAKSLTLMDAAVATDSFTETGTRAELFSIHQGTALSVSQMQQVYERLKINRPVFGLA